MPVAASLDECCCSNGRRASNLTRTLHTLERYGIVSLKEARTGGAISFKTAGRGGRDPLKPVVTADAIDWKLCV